jgi:hypothetical protein
MELVNSFQGLVYKLQNLEEVGDGESDAEDATDDEKKLRFSRW